MVVGVVADVLPWFSQVGQWLWLMTHQVAPLRPQASPNSSTQGQRRLRGAGVRGSSAVSVAVGKGGKAGGTGGSGLAAGGMMGAAMGYSSHW